MGMSHSYVGSPWLTKVPFSKIKNGYYSLLQMKNGHEEVFDEEFFPTLLHLFTLFATFWYNFCILSIVLTTYCVQPTHPTAFYTFIACLASSILCLQILHKQWRALYCTLINLIVHSLILFSTHEKNGVTPSSWFLTPN